MRCWACKRGKWLRPLRRSECSVTLNDNSSTPVAVPVEDDWLTREALADEMRCAGWLVLEADSGPDALAQLDYGAAIDVLITDIELSGPITGWDVAEHFRAAYPDNPVIYVSGKSIEPERMVAGGLFFSKPYDPAKLMETCCISIARHW
jgi:CheY-like chemotaxis protein